MKFKALSSRIFSECKVSLHLTLPLIISEIIYGLNGFVSTMMVAHLGSAALAANALVWNIWIALVLFFIGILSAVSIMVAHSYGANDKDGIRQVTQQGIIFAIVLSAPMMLAMILAPKILVWSGQEPAIIALARPYFNSLIWSMLPLNLIVILEQFLIGITLTRPAMFLSIITVPLQLLFSYVFTFGAFGFPNLGLTGMGYGILVSNLMVVIMLLFYIHFSTQCHNYKLLTNFWHFKSKYFWELFKVGTPIGGMYCIELALFAVIALMMGDFGANILAAHQIAMQCLMLSLAFIFGLSQGVSIRIGHEVGRKNKSSVKFVLFVNMGMGFCAMLLVSVLYLAFPHWIIGLDLDVNAAKYQALVENAVMLLKIAAIVQLIDCFRLISISALRSLKDTQIPMYISIIGFWLVAFPLSYLLGFHYHFNGLGIWFGLVLGLLTAAIISLIRFHWLLKRIDLASLVTFSD